MISSLEVSQEKLLSTLTALRIRAEQKQDDFFTQVGFQEARDFLHQFRYLNAIACRNIEANEWILWSNSLARKPVPSELLNAFQKTLMI